MEPDGDPKEVQPAVKAAKPVMMNQGLLRLKKYIAGGLELWDGITRSVKGLIAPFANLPVAIALALILIIGSVSASLLSYRQFAKLISGQSERIDAQIKKISELEKEKARLLASEERYKKNSIEARKKVLETEQALEKTIADSRKKLNGNASSGQASACPEVTKGSAYPEYESSKSSRPAIICNVESGSPDKGMERCIDELKRSNTGKKKPG